LSLSLLQEARLIDLNMSIKIAGVSNSMKKREASGDDVDLSFTAV